MRKIKYLLIMTLLVILPVKVYAAGSINVSTNNLNIKKGSSATFTITASNAAGKINISSSNNAVATVSSSSEFLDMQSATITVTGASVGNATITIYNADVTTYDDEDISGRSKTISVNVYEENTNNNNNNTNNNNYTQKKTNNYSTNNKLGSISVEGYNLEKIDDNNYKLTVANNITGINLSATAEDAKATVTGVGYFTLNIGENKIEVTITSESGAKNIIHLIVTKKDGYYLDELDTLINNEDLSEINININEESELSIEDLSKIKNTQKNIVLNYYDENKVLKYSWTINSSKVDESKPLQLGISRDSDNSKEITKSANYADGINIHFNYEGKLPEGTKIKLFVGDKYQNDDKINLYYYNYETEKLEKVHEALEVKEGYVEFELEHCSDYFMSMADLKEENVVTEKSNMFFVISIVEFLIIAGMVTYFFIKYKKNSKEII